MGTSSLLDIIGSMAVAGFLFLMVWKLNASANEASGVINQNLILQQNMTALVGIIEYDFRKIGYCKNWRLIPDATSSIRIADSTRLRFWADIDNDGLLDSITYTLGPTSELTTTPNPRDRLLYRQVNTAGAYPMNLGVTQFSLKYYDVENDLLAFPITDPRKAFFMQISIALESAYPQKLEFTKDTSGYVVYWRQIRLLTKNLRNR
jgi:hypothetical protein